MTRISKDPEVRRLEFIEAAITLFAAKGYAATTITDIVDAVGVAKGTFYHHFSSKEEVMHGVVVHLVEDGIAQARAIATAPDVSAPDTFLAVIASQSARGAKADLIDSLHEAGNAAFHMLSHTEMIRQLTPILAGVVRRGIQSGDFETPFPEESVRILLTAATFLTDGGIDQPGTDPQRTITALLVGAERMLGAESGAFLSRAAALGRSTP